MYKQLSKLNSDSQIKEILIKLSEKTGKSINQIIKEEMKEMQEQINIQVEAILQRRN
jgi:hypothetical protein